MMNRADFYNERIKTLTDEIYQLNRHNRLVVVLELTAIALAIGCVVVYTMWSSSVASLVATGRQACLGMRMASWVMPMMRRTSLSSMPIS